MKRLGILLMVLCFVIQAVSLPAIAEEQKGKLDAVEAEIDKGESSESSSSSSTSSASAGEILAQSFFDVLIAFMMSGIGSGMENSGEIYHELKSEWHPALPTIRVEPAYQWAAGNINAFSGSLEAGYLIFGMDGEFTRYFENQPTDTLDVWSAHFLLRSLFAKAFGINFAMGVKGVRGNRHRTGFDFGFPMYFFINRHFIIDIQDTFAVIKSTRIYDIGAGVSYKWKFIGARAGYRALFVGSERIHGPRIGVFFQF